VAYEVIEPSGLSPSEQFTLLHLRSSFAVAEWVVETDVSIDRLCVILTERKRASKYEMDGIIVNHDVFHPRVVGTNPDHAFAFKMEFSDQSAVTRVVAVNWDASKDGFLKPTVNFEPVTIGGVVIQYATGFNAAFIHTHGLGPGAFIEVIRSGDVIPYIKDVRMSAPDGAAMPTSDWHWNETHVDAVLDCLSGNADVQKKAMLYFANALQIEFCGEATISRLHDAGFDTVQKLVGLTDATLVRTVRGFQGASASKLASAIADATTRATVTQWAVGSGIFGRGIGVKRVEAAFTVVPKSLNVDDGLVTKLVALGGWSVATAESFCKALPEFERFMDSVGITPPAVVHVNEMGDVTSAGKLHGCVVMFTGFHPKDLAADVGAHGGKWVDGWSKSVTHLVVKDATIVNEKTKKAIAAGVAVLTAAQFRDHLS
jgi:DNA ligase (NAD+)